MGFLNSDLACAIIFVVNLRVVLGYGLAHSFVCWFASVQVEKNRFGQPRRGEGQFAGPLGARAIAGLQFNAVDRQRTFGDLQPRTPTRLEVVRDGLAGLEPNAIDVRVLMNRRRTVAAIG